MEKKRFQVVTFRGYHETDVLGDAVEMGRHMIDEIARDKWCLQFQWARVVDRNIGITFLIYRRVAGEFRYTPWLALR